MSSVPQISPIPGKEYKVKQSEYPVVGKLPIRSVILGPSGAGKGLLIQNLILDVYKDLFGRVSIFNPSINVDHTWEPVKKYLGKYN